MTVAPDGVLPVDKPGGWTSHDVVALARVSLGVRRIGHAGTLDPRATGLLPLLIGTATKFADRMHTAPKAYAALVLFGHETTTDDGEGTPTVEAAIPALDRDALDRALDPFRGEIEQWRLTPRIVPRRLANRRRRGANAASVGRTELDGDRPDVAQRADAKHRQRGVGARRAKRRVALEAEAGGGKQ